jgi:hypothetical protein
MMDAGGAEPDLRDLETFALAPSRFARGTRTLSKAKLADRGDMILTSHPAQPPHQTNARRLHRHDDAGMAAGAVGTGSVTPITIRKLHCGCAAPVMNHFRPLMT